MRAAAVRARLEAAGLEVIEAGACSIVARSSDRFVLAVMYPRGWMLQNARNSRAATKAAMAKRPEDVSRFCDDLSAGGAS